MDATLAAGKLEKFRDCLDIPISETDIDVTEVGGELR